MIEAILFIYNNNYDTLQMNILYQQIGKVHSLSPFAVKSNINNAINSMLSYNHRNELLLYNYFSEHDGRVPNTKYFISQFVYELRRHFPPDGYDKERIKKILYSI